MKRLKLYLFSAAMCLSFSLQAQEQSPEIQRYSEQYVKQGQENIALFNGKLQGIMPRNMESLYLREREYALTNKFSAKEMPRQVGPTASYDSGDVFYDGVFYSGVSMRLDLYRDELVVAPESVLSFGSVLQVDRFGYADLRGYRIILSPSKNLPGTYYLQLHDGPNEVLKKESFALNSQQSAFEFRTVRYYVKKDDIYHSVGKKKKEVLKLFDDRRDELRLFMRTNRINIRRNTENALVEVAKEYERLTER